MVVVVYTKELSRRSPGEAERACEDLFEVECASPNVSRMLLLHPVRSPRSRLIIGC